MMMTTMMMINGHNYLLLSRWHISLVRLEKSTPSAVDRRNLQDNFYSRMLDVNYVNAHAKSLHNVSFRDFIVPQTRARSLGTLADFIPREPIRPPARPPLAVAADRSPGPAPLKIPG